VAVVVRNGFSRHTGSAGFSGQACGLFLDGRSAGFSWRPGRLGTLGRARPLVVGRDLDRLALECLKPIETGLLSTGWIQFGRVRLAGRDLNVIWTGSRRVDGLALCWLDMVKIGWLLVNLI
jgi:hypothetical protein